jgi:outer membrane protein assembly factor BamB
VAAFDARKGTLLWQADVMGGDMAPSPIYVDGKAVFMFSGYGMYAMKTDGEGEVTDSHVAWQLDDLDESGLPDTSSPATDGKYIYVFNAGFLACVQASDGKVVYEHDTGAFNTYASPVVVGDKILLGAGEETLIYKAGPEVKLLGKGTLAASYDCTPAVADGRIYIRTTSKLYCIGKASAAKNVLDEVEGAVDKMREGVKEAADATEEAVDEVRKKVQDAVK